MPLDCPHVLLCYLCWPVTVKRAQFMRMFLYATSAAFNLVTLRVPVCACAASCAYIIIHYKKSRKTSQPAKELSFPVSSCCNPRTVKHQGQVSLRKKNGLWIAGLNIEWLIVCRTSVIARLFQLWIVL